jgi:rhodanese-related sulfurtransferase
VVAEGILTEAYNMAGGLAAWAEAGLPFETGPAST